MIQIIYTKNGLQIEAHFIKEYDKCKLFFCQDRVLLTTTDNKEIDSVDVLGWIDLNIRYSKILAQ